MSAMESTASLSAITMDPTSSEVMDFNFIQPPELTKGFPVVNRDGLEFTLGLERGDLKQYYGTPMNSTKLCSDMIRLFKSNKWTLLPSQEDLEGLRTLCTHNRASSTSLEDRVVFTLNFPPREYTYRLLPPRTSGDKNKPLHVGDKQYPYPYHNLPLIKTSIHPAFVLPSVNLYMLFTYEANPPVIDSVMQHLIDRISTMLDNAIPIAWTNGTWDEYDHRGLVLVRDYPRNPRLRKDTPPPEDGYVTPEERDVKSNDPRRVRREKKMQKYMDEHNERSTKLAMGAALNLKTHQSANTPTHQSDNIPTLRDNTSMHQSDEVSMRQSTTSTHKADNIPLAEEAKAKADVGGAVGKRVRSTTTPDPGEQPLRKRRRMKSRSKQGSTRSTSPTDQTMAPLRRSARTPKVPPKYA